MVPRRKNKVTPPPGECPLGNCMAVIGGAWTPNIIWFLTQDARRFSELKSDIVGISAKMLATRLKRLEADGIVLRTVMPTSPPTVEYSLTEQGRALKPVLDAIVEVGQQLKMRPPSDPAVQA